MRDLFLDRRKLTALARRCWRVMGRRPIAIKIEKGFRVVVVVEAFSFRVSIAIVAFKFSLSHLITIARRQR